MSQFDPIASPTNAWRTTSSHHSSMAIRSPWRNASSPTIWRAARSGPTSSSFLMDDVGWGDFGCYGGGVAVGAPTPNFDKLARNGLQLTSCYSEPTCSPSRATLMTGRVPNRHGLHRPPMYGEPGGLQGEVTLAQLLVRRRIRHAGGRQVALGENVESQPRMSASTISTASSRCPTCTPNGATRISSPRSSTRKRAPNGSRTCRSTAASCTPRKAAEARTSRR